MGNLKKAWLAGLGAVFLAWAPAQNVAPQPWNCNLPEFRQFDFWVGEWEVVDRGSGTPVGRNRIEKIQGGCSLQENWTGTAGDTGISINTYYPPEKRWHQVWVSNVGAFLRISGEFKDGKMVLEGESVQPIRGARVLNRVTWSIYQGNPDQVLQFWEISTDGGRTWQVGFDGLYKRKK